VGCLRRGSRCSNSHADAQAIHEITYSRLVPADLERIGEINRTEQIDTLYAQHGDRLERRFGDFSASSASAISPQAELHWECLRMGDSWGIGIVRPHIRPRIA
jgi:hypothetical protein